VLPNTLLSTCSLPEIEAIVAQDLAHWVLGHRYRRLILDQTFIIGSLAVFPAFLRAGPIMTKFGFSLSAADRPPALIAYLLYSVRAFSQQEGPITDPAQFLLHPIYLIHRTSSHVLTHRQQYAADAFAATMQLATSYLERSKDDAAPANQSGQMRQQFSEALVSLALKDGHGVIDTVWADHLWVDLPSLRPHRQAC
jgi:hypothetical protein